MTKPAQPVPSILLLHTDFAVATVLAAQLSAKIAGPIEIATTLARAKTLLAEQQPDVVLQGGAWPATALQKLYAGQKAVVLTLSLPVRLPQLQAQIMAATRRAVPLRQLSFGDLMLDERSRMLRHKSGQMQTLTTKEIAILKHLLKHKKPLTQQKLLQDIWGHTAALSTHTLATHLYRLRQKCKKLGVPNMIVTKDGGYTLAAD